MIVPSSGGAEDGISKVARWVWQWKYTIFIPVLISVFLGFTTYLDIPTRYTSQAVLVMDARHRQVLPGASFMSPLPQESPVLKTQLDIISSRNTAAYVIDLLADRGVALTPPLKKEHPAVQVGRTVINMIGAPIVMAWARDEEPSEIQPGAQDTRAKVDDLLAGLRVTNDGSSYTIYIEYVSPDAAFAAAAANAFADAYLEKQLAIYDEAAARARDFLGPRVESLRAQLAETELRRQSRRQEAGLTPDGFGAPLVARYTDLSTELASVRAAIAEAHARLETAKEASPASGTSVDSPQIQILISEKSKLENQRTHLIEQGALKSQLLAQIEQELDTVNLQITAEFQRALGRLAQEIVVQERKKVILETEINKMRDALEDNAGAVIDVAQLDREVEASSAIYESYLARYKETVEQQGIAAPDARLISAAELGVPDGVGRLAKWLMASFVIGGVFGGAGALGRSSLVARRASPEGVVAETEATVLGFLPRLSAARARQKGGAELDPGSLWGAEFALMQMNLSLPYEEEGACSVIAITSVANGDGKTTVAVGLAQSLASTGARMLLIDCDMQGPTVSQYLGLSDAPPSVEPKFDEPALTPENLQKVSWGCDVISLANGAEPRSFAQESRRLRAVIQEARAKYDVVILDCPAMGDHPEATHLAAAADLAIHVARWPRSPMLDVRLAVEQLAAILPQQRVGVVFTRLDPRHRNYTVIPSKTNQLREV